MCSIRDYLHLTENQLAKSKAAPEMLKLYLVLYDSLLDDEEDVRDTGAAAASELLISITAHSSTTDARIPLMVPAARHEFLEFLKSHYHSSPHLWAEAVTRLVHGYSTLEPSSLTQNPRFPSPKALLTELKQDDTALFVEEKQNLYIDETQEASVWQAVLLSLDQSAVSRPILHALESWTVEGLNALTEVAKAEEDGPLGWTSKPDVFTLGMRILLSAQALLCFTKNQQLSVDADGLRARLKQLLEVGEVNSLRPTWMRIIRAVLEDRDPNQHWCREVL